MAPDQLVAHKEESEESGGFFIVNGNEKLIRMLIIAKRNYPLAVVRNTMKNRGPSYTEYGIQLRSVRPDQSSKTIHLHYLSDGNVIFRFSWRKNEYLVPVMLILKALVETNDQEIFMHLVDVTDAASREKQQLVIDRVEMLLRTYKVYDIHGKTKARAYLGSKFRPVLGVSDDCTDENAGTELLRKVVLPHLGSQDVDEGNDADKFSMLLFMLKKLYALVEGECAADNVDAVSNQELLLGGFLYGVVLKEKLEDWLDQIRVRCNEWCRTKKRTFEHPDFFGELPSKILGRTNEKIGALMEYFLSTGNLTSSSGLDLQQANGFTIVAEKLNFHRFISHFRCVHRGSYFTGRQMTTVRKLLPESWGYLCPVHTPDGAPCGLLNHLAHQCKVATMDSDTSALVDVIASMGLSSSSANSPRSSLTVQLDGRILGFCSAKRAREISDSLRHWKVEHSHGIPLELEIGYVPPSMGGQYPGIYMFSHAARMYRPVRYLPLSRLDYVGPFEQPFLSIACTSSEITPGSCTTHVEFDPTNILSILANMTPFSEFNQSPRNMYQCQMSKQSMGTPGAAIAYRTDNKMYRLQSGQSPLVRPPLYNAYGLDNFPNGTNAVVAVISYTGYDMDDAMILNKSAHERGFAHGTIYKVKVLDLEEDSRKSRSVKTLSKIFGFCPGTAVRAQWQDVLDEDGLPYPGREVGEGDVIAASHNVVWDASTESLRNIDGRTELHRYKDLETAFVEEVRVHGAEDGSTPCHSVSIKYRVPRSPVIGDKFSSRHGQKGICSQKWPNVDMPFSESGMSPDILINPHAFPSRMTIGMFVESLAGKAGALHGFAQDSTPFKFEDRKGGTAVEYFGHQLRAAGYNYHGNEPMYSGITGQELAADIYIGVVYYQRLRHMVNDKFQVRTTGPVNPATGQPIKGRSRGGGIRVGEMERDALLAHGTAFLLQDRLLNCSDYTKAWICRKCGSFLSTTPSVGGYGAKKRGTNVVRCRMCAKRAEAWRPKSEVWEDGAGMRWTGGEDTTVVAIPGVLRYLDAEVAAMGVRMKFKVSP